MMVKQKQLLVFKGITMKKFNEYLTKESISDRQREYIKEASELIEDADDNLTSLYNYAVDPTNKKLYNDLMKSWKSFKAVMEVE